MRFVNAPKNANGNVYLGPWSSAITYNAGDIVSKSTYLYYSLSTNTNLDPPANTSDWLVINFVPSNTGTSGQILTKTGALDTNYSWQNPPAATIDKHNVIARWDATVTYTDHDMAIDANGVPWVSLQNNNINHATPLDGTSANAWWGFPPLSSNSTGSAGQVLTKNGADWYDYGWKKPPAATVDKKSVIAKWDATVTYGLYDMVMDSSGIIWASQQANNLNHAITSAFDDGWWSAPTMWARSVGSTGQVLTKMDNLWNHWDWAEPTVLLPMWDETKTYYSGDIVFDSYGLAWVASAESTNEDPSADEGFWTLASLAVPLSGTHTTGQVLTRTGNGQLAYEWAEQQKTLYGTGDPPSPVGLAEGTIYIKYI